MISIPLAFVAFLYLAGGGLGLLNSWTAEMIPRAGTSVEYALRCFTSAPATALAAHQMGFGLVLAAVSRVAGWFKV